MPRRAVGFVPVPYHRTLKAIAFAGHQLWDVRRVLEHAMLEYPRDKEDNIIKRRYMSLRYHAREIRPSFEFSDEECREHEIDVMYHYVRANGKRGVNPKADFVCKILVDSHDLMLRQMIDSLLFVGVVDPAIIRDRIYNNSVTPSTEWGIEEIGFYRDFFWDTTVMSSADWVKYRKWFRYNSPKLFHIEGLTMANSRQNILISAKLNSGLSDLSMLNHAKDVIYGLLSKAHRVGDAERVAKLTSALNKTISTSAKDLGDDDSRRKFAEAIERIETPLDGSIGEIVLMARSGLGEDADIGDRAKTDQLDSVLDGEYDTASQGAEDEDVSNVIQP